MLTSDEMGLYYDPYDAEINSDPYPTFTRLRDEYPLYYNDRYDFWVLSRHLDVEKALTNWQTFSNARSDMLEIIQSGAELPPGVVQFEDPPLHSVHRGVMGRVFTPRRMAALEDQVREFCGRCLDPLVGTDGFDFITELAAELPMRVIGMLLGVPESDQPSMREKTRKYLATESGKPMKIRPKAIANGDMFADYIEWRSKHPSDDLMTALLTAEFEDETGATRRLTRPEVLTYTQNLAGAGSETTGRFLGWLVKVLADHPDQRRDLVEDRSLIPRAVEETLRFEPNSQHAARYVAQDVEYYGQTVPAGSAMLLLLGSANRDPRRHDDPDTFNIHRKDTRHLTFGIGMHYCLGANLARLEGRIAVDEMLNRFPEWDVDYDAMKLASTSTSRGWETLPVQLR